MVKERHATSKHSEPKEDKSIALYHANGRAPYLPLQLLSNYPTIFAVQNQQTTNSQTNNNLSQNQKTTTKEIVGTKKELFTEQLLKSPLQAEPT